MKRIAIWTVLVCSMMSCANNENAPYKSEHPILDVSAVIENGNQTKALINSFKDNDELAVFVNGSGYTPIVSKYKLTGTTWNFPVKKEEIIALRLEEANVYAFYPATASLSDVLNNENTNKLKLTCAAENTGFKGENLIDYLYSNGETKVSASNIKVKLTLKHALSKLSFVINKGYGYTLSGALTKLELINTSVFKTGDAVMQFTDGAMDYSLSTDVSTISYDGTATINDYKATPMTTTTAECLVYPNADNTTISVKLTVDGIARTVKLPVGTLGSSWEAGKNYKYVITVYETQIVFDKVSIEEWQESESLPSTELS